MASIEPLLPGTPRQMLWVRRPDGEPKQCYEDQLSYAMANGYVQCAAPGDVLPDVDVAAVAPDETDQDRAERLAQQERGDGPESEDDDSLPASGGVDNASSIMGAPADVTPKTVVDPPDTPKTRADKRAAAKAGKKK